MQSTHRTILCSSLKGYKSALSKPGKAWTMFEVSHDKMDSVPTKPMTSATRQTLGSLQNQPRPPDLRGWVLGGPTSGSRIMALLGGLTMTDLVWNVFQCRITFGSSYECTGHLGSLQFPRWPQRLEACSQPGWITSLLGRPHQDRAGWGQPGTISFAQAFEPTRRSQPLSDLLCNWFGLTNH